MVRPVARPRRYGRVWPQGEAGHTFPARGDGVATISARTTDVPGAITVHLLDHAGNVRSVAEPFEIALGTSDATVMGFAGPTVTFHPDALESDIVQFVPLKVGAASLIVRDPRSPARYDPEATTALVMRPQ